MGQCEFFHHVSLAGVCLPPLEGTWVKPSYQASSSVEPHHPAPLRPLCREATSSPWVIKVGCVVMQRCLSYSVEIRHSLFFLLVLKIYHHDFLWFLGLAISRSWIRIFRLMEHLCYLGISGREWQLCCCVLLILPAMLIFKTKSALHFFYSLAICPRLLVWGTLTSAVHLWIFLCPSVQLWFSSHLYFLAFIKLEQGTESEAWSCSTLRKLTYAAMSAYLNV